MKASPKKLGINTLMYFDLIGKKLALLDLLIATSRDGILTGSDIEGEINGFLFAVYI